MGSNNGEANEKPVHRVTIAQTFAIGKTEMTQGQWKAIMGNNPSHFSGGFSPEIVEKTVRWKISDGDDVQEFIKELNAKTGKQYRLSSEAEWEYACRAGGQQEYCDRDNLDNVAWDIGNSDDMTHPVAQKQANAFGLYDMSGNVWEWVEDSWHNNCNGAPTDGSVWHRVGDGVTPVALSHHRTCGSAYGGSLNTLKALLCIQQRNQPHFIKEAFFYWCAATTRSPTCITRCRLPLAGATRI